MPTLIFDHSFNEQHRRVLQTTHKVTCDKLKISKHDCTIAMRRAPIGSKRQKAMMTRLPCGNFVFLVNDLIKTLHGIMPAFCHELVHVKQYLTGQMKDANGGVEWNGRFIPDHIAQSELAYEHLPWEKEAFAKMFDLARDSLLALTYTDAEQVRKEGNEYEATRKSS